MGVMKFTMDLRIRVLDACDSGMGTTEVAETFSVSKAWIKILKKRRRDKLLPNASSCPISCLVGGRKLVANLAGREILELVGRMFTVYPRNRRVRTIL